MGTHPDPEAPDDQQLAGPSDGPAREPGSGGDAGSTSQDRPDSSSADASSSAGAGQRADPPGHEAEGPADSNERADERARVVAPPNG
ncbi:MAG: hypothetical protein LC808_32780 [Actinobacteria bacterium]|nr:hypothetical protein [Actinomycetota bacterium]